MIGIGFEFAFGVFLFLVFIIIVLNLLPIISLFFAAIFVQLIKYINGIISKLKEIKLRNALTFLFIAYYLNMYGLIGNSFDRGSSIIFSFIFTWIIDRFIFSRIFNNTK